MAGIWTCCSWITGLCPKQGDYVMAGTITVKPGETLTVVGVPVEANLPPYIPGPVDPGYSPPWARPGGRPTHPIALPGDPWWGGGGPVDPGYSPPGVGPGVPGTRPPPGGVDPGYGNPWFDPHPSHPIVIPPEGPPPTQPPPSDSGNWVWAWSPQAGRWVWVKVPGAGEAGPKTA